MEELRAVKSSAGRNKGVHAAPRSPWWTYLPPLLVGLTIRLGYALVVTQPPIPKGADQYYYRGQAALITRGYWWVVPGSVNRGSPGLPGIAHPPLFSGVLAVADFLDLHSMNDQRAFLCVIGVTAVVSCGRVGERLWDKTGEVSAAWVAAILPGMWIYNGEVLSETVTVPLVAATLLALYRVRESGTIGRTAVLGLLVGLCALTRPELIILVVPFAPFWIRTRLPRSRAMLTAAFLVALLVLVGPWIGRNLHDFRDTEVMSSNFGSVIVGANCGPTYSGPLLGTWDVTCATVVRPPPGDASTADYFDRHLGEDYARKHQNRIPAVAAARLGRALGVWPAPSDEVGWNAVAAGVWPRWASWLYLVTWLSSIPFAVVGAVSLRRRRVVAWPLYTLLILYLVVSVVLYADPRFASSCQPALAVLVGAGLAALISRVGRGRRTRKSAVLSKQGRQDSGPLPAQ
jgi:4-amino-4-deoxy-L-arabinose transferase-like glycosyltransferase